MASNEHWLGPAGRRGLLLKRLGRFFYFLPRVVMFRKRKVRGYLRRTRLIRTYLASHDVAKLQLGAAGTVIDGWLNTSLRPRSPHIVFLDVTEPFPFDDGVFDYIMSEHLIEHLRYNDGQYMLAECLRVLKPGGKIRLSTPNLRKLAGLLLGEDERGARYVGWIASTFPRDVPVPRSATVVNNLFYNWGHRFLYDFPTLKEALETSGFMGVTECRLGKSEDPALDGAERHVGGGGLEGEMTRFEALVVEAVRPAT